MALSSSQRALSGSHTQVALSGSQGTLSGSLTWPYQVSNSLIRLSEYPSRLSGFRWASQALRGSYQALRWAYQALKEPYQALRVALVSGLRWLLSGSQPYKVSNAYQVLRVP